MNVFNATLGVLWRSISAFFVEEYEREDAFKSVPTSGIPVDEIPACGGVLCAKRAHSVTCPRKSRKKSSAKKSSVKKSGAKKKSAKKSPARKPVRKKSRA